MRLKEICEFEKSLLLSRFGICAKESMLTLGRTTIKFEQILKIRGFPRGSDLQAVPDWTDLGPMARALILEKGYRDKDIAEIAREAAIANGMSK
jgi:hypothetical protein